MQTNKISDKDSAKRLDSYVSEQLPDLSRASAQKLIAGEKALVNQKPNKTGYKLRVGDEVTINYQPAAIPDIDLPILYEDNDCVVIEKPLGVLTHSKGAFNPEGTVATWLKARLSDDWVRTAGGAQASRLGIVHRLDRATSGVMICAKNPAALSQLQKQFSLRKVKKTYLAVVKGVPEQREAIIDMPIERHPKKPQTFRVGTAGKPSITQYKILQSTDDYSLLELKPQTGRTHQLRVHMKQLGHPIVGDTVYDGMPANRMMLHAASLEITLPDRSRRTFTSPMPDGFAMYTGGLK